MDGQLKNIMPPAPLRVGGIKMKKWQQLTFIHSCGDVASDKSKQYIKSDDTHHQCPSVGWRQEATCTKNWHLGIEVT